MFFPNRNTTRAIRRGYSRRGGAAIELAVVFPILLLLIIGVADYGRVFFTSITVANAARAGAEWGAQSPAAAIDTAGMKVFAQQDGNEVGTLTLAARRYCQCAGAANPTCSACGVVAPEVYVEVTATKAVAMLLAYPGLPSTVTIIRKATFRPQ